MKWQTLILTTTILTMFVTFTAYGSTILTPEILMESTRNHYPQIKMAQAALESNLAEVQKTQGAFDLRFEQSLSKRMTGFYDGQQVDNRIVQPLEDFNSQIYGGYRISDGSFPIYEDGLFTNDGGEFRVGAQVSLLRDRLIDLRRVNLKNANINSEIANLELLITKIDVHQQALQAYWNWVASGQVLIILEEMQELLASRQQALEKKISHGNIAEIFLTESQQSIAQLKSQILTQQRILQQSSNRLSLYYRNASGQPITPDILALPKSFPKTKRVMNERQLELAIEEHPLLNQLQQKLLIEEQNQKLGKNLQLPSANLKVEISDDQGDGSFTRSETEAVAKLEISFPLQRNEGKGLERKSRAKIDELTYQISLEQDRFKQQLSDLLAALNATSEIINTTKEEVNLSKKMQSAERQRFESGDSDFFILNTRDQALANAKIKHVEAQFHYHKTLVDLNALTLNKQELMIKSY